MPSKIQWLADDAGMQGDTWNPLLGCRKKSPGCFNCYAIKEVHRMAGNPNPKIGEAAHGLTMVLPDGSLNWTGKVNLLPARLLKPLHWRRPRRIFPNSLSDPWHDSVPDEFVAAMFAVMALTPHHQYLLLTKRPERALEWYAKFQERGRPGRVLADALSAYGLFEEAHRLGGLLTEEKYVRVPQWPLPNLWLGASTERQEEADERMDNLLACPAAVHWISYEPAIGPLVLRPEWTRGRLKYTFPVSASGAAREYSLAPLRWVVAGGESGALARPFELEWAHALLEQCRAFDVAFFMKQKGVVMARRLGWLSKKGEDMSEWPEWCRVREYPERLAA